MTLEYIKLICLMFEMCIDVNVENKENSERLVSPSVGIV